MAVVLVLGARPKGQTSSRGPNTKATSAWRVSVLWALPVSAIKAVAKDRNGPKSRTISSLSPLCDRIKITSFG